ncbi:Endonuclease/exonuclease/phosphatase [Pelagophyceae sp. CCMP2097]|nr:Endonuclease/exonuclease/phosphatase [Pelagophyceae sp. CCMP2097]
MAPSKAGPSGAASSAADGGLAREPAASTDIGLPRELALSAAPSSAPPPPGHAPLHLVSWNVAGWKTSVETIVKTACFDAADGASAKVSGAKVANGAAKTQRTLAAWLEALAVDVLCIQEAKLKSTEVCDRQRDYFAASDAYESFWACNDGKAAAAGQRSGLNGVATFARRAGPHRVRSADCAPLGFADLDDEGRCLKTDHGAFVLFNCYVPNAAGGARAAFKARWLGALRDAVQRETKPVIVAGDLNLKARGADSHWAHRTLDASRLSGVGERLAAGEAPQLAQEDRRVLAAWASAWPAVRSALAARTIARTETINPETKSGEKFERYRTRARPCAAAACKDGKEGALVLLGKFAHSEGAARAAFEVGGLGLSKGQLTVGLEGCDVVLRLPDEVGSADLAEAFEKLASLRAKSATLAAIVASGLLASGRVDPSTAWLHALLEEQNMVDSFVELHGAAVERFTCWEQYTNRRYDNEGSRIDYVLVARQLFEASRPVAGALDVGRLTTEGPGTARAALAAATLSSAFQCAPFSGGGVPEPRAADCVHHASVAPHTGIVYTPPSWSDHVGVSLLLAAVAPAAEARPDAAQTRATTRAQPHARTKPISAFFARAPPRGTPPPPGESRAAKRQAPPKPAPKGSLAGWLKKPKGGA